MNNPPNRRQWLVAFATVTCTTVYSSIALGDDTPCTPETSSVDCLTKGLGRVEIAIGQFQRIEDKIKSLEKDIMALQDKEQNDKAELAQRVVDSMEVFVREGSDNNTDSNATCGNGELLIGGSCIAHLPSNPIIAIGPVFNNATDANIVANSVHCYPATLTPVRAYAVCMRPRKK